MFPFTFPGALPNELGFFVPAALLGAVIAALFVGRRDPGTADDRLGARYLGAISLLALFVAVFAAFAAAQALTDLMVDHTERAVAIEESYEQDNFVDSTSSGLFEDVFAFQTYEFNRSNDANYDAAVGSGIAALTAGAVFVFHRRRRLEMIGAPGFAGSPAAVVNRTYLQGAKFVAALSGALAAAAALYGLWQVIAPGIAGAATADVGRAEGVSAILSSGVFLAAVALIYLRADNELGRA
jgi:hypothetical protein